MCLEKGTDKFYFDSYGVQPPSELIAYLKSAQSKKCDAVNKAYVDGIKYKTATGNIHNTVMKDHTLHISRCENVC